MEHAAAVVMERTTGKLRKNATRGRRYTGFSLENHLRARLAQLARERDQSTAAVLRSAVREYLCQHAPVAEDVTT